MSGHGITPPRGDVRGRWCTIARWMGSKLDKAQLESMVASGEIRDAKPILLLYHMRLRGIL